MGSLQFLLRHILVFCFEPRGQPSGDKIVHRSPALSTEKTLVFGFFLFPVSLVEFLAERITVKEAHISRYLSNWTLPELTKRMKTKDEKHKKHSNLENSRAKEAIFELL